MVVSYAGFFKSTDHDASGATFGFKGQTSPELVPFPDAKLSGGVLRADFGSAGALRIPLPTGAATLPSDGAGTLSPLGPVTGTTFRSADGTFFYADLTPVRQPSQREFVAGGMPVSKAFLDPTGSTRIFAFSIQPDAALQAKVPFVRNASGGSLPGAVVSPLYMVAPPTTAIGDATTVDAARTLQGSLAISGRGAGQQSVVAMGVGTVQALESSGLPIIGGVVRGSSQQDAAAAPVRIGSALTSVADGKGQSLYGKDAISGFVLDQTQYSSSAAGSGVLTTPVVPSTADEVPLSVSRPPTTYGINQPATPQPLPAGVGASRTTQTLKGYFGGLMNTTAQPDPYVITGKTSLSTAAASNRIEATLTSDRLSGAGGIRTIQMQFGGLTGNAGGREAFIDDNVFGVAESQPDSTAPPRGQPQPQKIDGKPLVVGGDPAQAGKLYLMSSGTAPPPTSLLPAGAAYCTCEFLRWGYWGGDLRTGSDSSSAITRIDRGHINFWMAGQPTPIADISRLAGMGTADYAGHLIGSVFNAGRQYIAAGGLNASYNFGTQIGSFAVVNYDGLSFSATGTAPLTGSTYTFKLNRPSGVPLTGAINGGFFGPNAKDTGGNFSFSGAGGFPYFTSGIFAATKKLTRACARFALLLAGAAANAKDPPGSPAGLARLWRRVRSRSRRQRVSWGAGRCRWRCRDAGRERRPARRPDREHRHPTNASRAAGRSRSNTDAAPCRRHNSPPAGSALPSRFGCRRASGRSSGSSRRAG